MSIGIGYVEYQGFRLRDDPARDACFDVVETEAEMVEFPWDDPRGVRQLVHRHMTNEVTSLDIAAACLAEFPDAPWELRMELARQCWDEARHVQVLERRLRELGGRRGEFPISVFEWSVTSAIPSIEGRLAVQNRTLEAGAMDVVGGLERDLQAAGDPGTAEVLHGILADEVQHVRFANRWIRTLAARDPRVLLKVASSVRLLSDVNGALRRQAEAKSSGEASPSQDPEAPAVNVEDRRLAGFSEEEIHEILRQAGFRSLIPVAGSEVDA